MAEGTPEPFLAILRKRPGDVEWFFESHDEKSESEAKWMIERSAGAGAGDAALEGEADGLGPATGF